LFSALLAADARELGTRNPGWTSDTASGASDAARGYVSMCVGALTQGCLALAFFAFLLACSPLAALLVTLACGLLTALSFWFVRWEARLAQQALDAQSQQQELLHGFLASLAALRGLCCGERLAGRWRAALGRAVLASTARVRAATLRSLTLSGIQRVVGLGVTTWAVLRCVSSELGVGEMFLVTGLAAGLSGSLLALSGSWLGFRALAPQFARLNLVLGAARSSDLPSPAAEWSAASEADDRLVVEGLSFRYREGERWILKDHAFEMRRGELCRLDSPSGSGKSTFLKLMAGLLTPTRGQIRVFGLNPRDARQLVLYVPQHCSLLEASIGENLRLLSGASDLEIARVARLTGLAELLAELPMGLETPVAAQGQNFSSGQRQLIVLSAAFASARPVLLLDEAMSQIDLGTRRRMDFPALIHNRTVILVEHQR
jgi:ATP-binding cassette subfamily B protein RaxB